MRENKIAEQGKNHNTKTKNVKDSDRRTGEIPERFRIIMVLLSCYYVNAQLGLQKHFCSIQIMREGETLPHEEKVTIFGDFLPKKFKKCFSQSGALPNSNFPSLPIPHSLILRKNHAPISFSCVDIARCGFLIKNCNLT